MIFYINPSDDCPFAILFKTHVSTCRDVPVNGVLFQVLRAAILQFAVELNLLFGSASVCVFGLEARAERKGSLVGERHVAIACTPE